MPTIIDQLPNSNLSLVGKGFTAEPNSPAWGYPDGTGNLDPYSSRLHLEYSLNGNPDVRIRDFNSWAYGGISHPKPQSTLDELDRDAPFNSQARASQIGPGGSVVSQIYKSPNGQQYKQKGPAEGRY
jgi:hypothetical protein